MTPPSIRDLVLLAPRPLRKFIRYRILPKGMAETVARKVDEGRDPLSWWWQARPKANAFKPGRSVRWYTEHAWGGFSEDALVGLEYLKSHPLASPKLVSDAARALGVWYASHGDYERGHQNAVLARIAFPEAKTHKQLVNLEADCLFATGDNDRASIVIDAALKESPQDSCLLLTKANTLAGFNGWTDLTHEEERLQWINQVFANAGLTLLERKDPSRALSFDNIRGIPVACSIPREAQPLISVLVPAYMAQDTLRFTVESILAQSWENLEVVIVDDKSPDATFALAEQLSREDARVRAHCLAKNSGAYVARNEAMRQSRGEYITIHDADDWSHPQKIEMQMKLILNGSTPHGNWSDWVRCRFNLFFRGGARIGAFRVAANHSSLIVRRQTALDLGGWDEVRVGADNDFVRRLQYVTGLDRIPRAAKLVPLSFGLELDSSLTRSKVSHVFTLYHGVRRCYHEASAYWINKNGHETSCRLPAEGRAFPAPYEMLRIEPPSYDLLVIMDFGIYGGAFNSTLNYILSALQMGKRVAAFHYRRFDLDSTNPPSSPLLELAQQGKIYIVPPGGKIDVKTVLVGYPPILNSKIDLPPEIAPEQLFIITNQMHARLYSGGDVQYDPGRVAENVRRLFGVTPTWIPISDLVRNLMISDGRYAPIHPQTWTPLIETDTWCKEQVRYRGGKGARPVIGRHGRDHYTKWPQTAEAIAAAYCADRETDVRLLGGAKVPQKILKHSPANWTVYPFDALDSREFLLDLDFFVHFPHEDYIEEFGRAVLEAMAVGVPVILPEVFRPTFGDAALYATPEEVWPTIERVWNDEIEWRHRSLLGSDFVRNNSDWSQLPARLAGLEE